jgi:type VI secretion system protein ImpH
VTALDPILARARELPFVTLVSSIERARGTKDALGGDGPFHNEAIRFRHDPSLVFHTHDISAASRTEYGVELTTTFAGLTGSASPLAPMLLEAMTRDDDDGALQREFLDLFHHRLLSLFYRGLLKHDLARAAQTGPLPRILGWLLGLAGLPYEHAERTSGLELATLLRLLPLLVCYPPNATRLSVAIRDVLGDVLGQAKVHVVPMTGGYVSIAESARARLGVDARLGKTTALGGCAGVPVSEVCVQIASLCPDSCRRLSPGGDRHAELVRVSRLFAPETVCVTLELTPSQTPRTRLGRTEARLGTRSWLGGSANPKPVRFKAQSSPREDHHAR